MPLPTVPARDAPTPVPAPPPAGAACVSCGLAADTPFCPGCGERRASDRRYTLAELGGEAFESLTDLDGRIWRTLRVLVLQPGELTRAYMRGSRVPFLPPVQLFFLVNVAYFLWAAWAGEHVFDTLLANHFDNSNYGDWARGLVERRVAERGIDAEEYARAFNAATSVQARSLIVVMAPMFAAMLALLQIRRRRTALEHLTFSLHLYAVLLLVAISQRYLVQWPIRLWIRLTGHEAKWDMLITAFVLGSVMIYCALAIRRVYGDRWPGTMAKTLVLSVWIMVVLALYRALLFSVTFWST